MKVVGKIIYQIYKWIIFIPVFAIASIVFSLGAALFAVLVSPAAGSMSGVMWAKTVAFFTPMRVKVSGKENIKKGRSYVIVANHQSAYDIFALYGFLGIDFRWIMKKELRHAFFIGPASAKVGHIFIDRSSPKAAFDSINEAKEKLVNGTSVVIFPEGTRSGSNTVRRFKSGAFKMAEELELPILPVTIKDTHKVYGGGIFNVHPGKVHLTINPCIDTSKYKGDIHGLMADTKEALIAPIKEYN
ncbi:lysophospholipid acyltransferase family protein [Saccharicrinis fermentans]|uniref:1-acyl-sn-glycerol-3-phosphate acyltransferase n=1 Tax=Saccharicrinis fermentans DSM 9555 = JCM 21142 TaxID=869213 RepID=W7Y0G1_9BACT|nr:lysophospholipid acyltransferase family protein [Saccharicrinis fermentans]GAF04405.1 1-acyl-SN-glycerol-3-phosphate acyltransferase [Saccharicrinis fermentans DSM 9555 = JCM 21142]